MSYTNFTNCLYQYDPKQGSFKPKTQSLRTQLNKILKLSNFSLYIILIPLKFAVETVFIIPKLSPWNMNFSVSLAQIDPI